MPYIKSWILNHYTIEIADIFSLQISSALLSMYRLFHLCCPGNLWFLSQLKRVGRTLEFTTLYVTECPGTYFWGSYCECGTFFHGIWGSSAIPAPQGGVDPESNFYYGLFNKTHAHGRGIPPGIICACWTEHWHFFLVNIGIWILYIYHLFAWVHDTYWRLLLRPIVAGASRYHGPRRINDKCIIFIYLY